MGVENGACVWGEMCNMQRAWERLKGSCQLQCALWPSPWTVSLGLCSALWWFMRSVCFLSDCLHNRTLKLDLTCQIHLIHSKLDLNSAGSAQCITPHSSIKFIFLDPSFYHPLWFMYMLWPKETIHLQHGKYLCMF